MDQGDRYTALQIDTALQVSCVPEVECFRSMVLGIIDFLCLTVQIKTCKSENVPLCM